MTPKENTMPFLMRFSDLVERPPTSTARYDRSRHTVQYLVDGKWVDAPDAPTAGGTYITATRAETTDDK